MALYQVYLTLALCVIGAAAVCNWNENNQLCSVDFPQIVNVVGVGANSLRVEVEECALKRLRGNSCDGDCMELEFNSTRIQSYSLCVPRTGEAEEIDQRCVLSDLNGNALPAVEAQQGQAQSNLEAAAGEVPARGHGVTYNVRTLGLDSNRLEALDSSHRCLLPEEVDLDLTRISQRFDVLRLYALTDCPETVRAIMEWAARSATTAQPLRVHVGLFLSPDSREVVEAELEALRALVNDPALASLPIEAVSGGNEAIFQLDLADNNCDLRVVAEAVAEHMRRVRTIVRASPFHADVPLTYVDEWTEFCQYQDILLPEVDRVDVNLYTFFSTNYGDAEENGGVDAVAERVATDTLAFAEVIAARMDLASGDGPEKAFVLSEAGWPSAGEFVLVDTTGAAPEIANFGSRELAELVYRNLLVLGGSLKGNASNARRYPNIIFHEDHDANDKVTSPLYEQTFGLFETPSRLLKYPDLFTPDERQREEAASNGSAPGPVPDGGASDQAAADPPVQDESNATAAAPEAEGTLPNSVAGDEPAGDGSDSGAPAPEAGPGAAGDNVIARVTPRDGAVSDEVAPEERGADDLAVDAANSSASGPVSDDQLPEGAISREVDNGGRRLLHLDGRVMQRRQRKLAQAEATLAAEEQDEQDGEEERVQTMCVPKDIAPAARICMRFGPDTCEAAQAQALEAMRIAAVDGLDDALAVEIEPVGVDAPSAGTRQRGLCQFSTQNGLCSVSMPELELILLDELQGSGGDAGLEGVQRQLRRDTKECLLSFIQDLTCRGDCRLVQTGLRTEACVPKVMLPAVEACLDQAEASCSSRSLRAEFALRESLSSESKRRR